HARATAEVEDLLRADSPKAAFLYDAACVFALSAGKAGDEALRARYATRAVALLRAAAAQGYKDLAHLKQDSDPDVLRSRADFQQLVKELEAKVSPPAR